jgi:hypothetical protein
MNIIKNILRKKLLEYITFADKYQKQKYIEVPQSDINLFADKFAELIKNAYASKGGNFEINSGNDILSGDLKFWMAKDIDDDPDADITFGGKKTQHGIKITTMGQDGSSESKKDAINKLIDLMNTRGFYIEMDLDLAQKLNIPIIDDEDKIRTVLNKNINYLGNGEYERQIAGHAHKKVLVGKPKI